MDCRRVRACLQGVMPWGSGEHICCLPHNIPAACCEVISGLRSPPPTPPAPPPYPLAALGCYRANLRVRRSRVTWASAWQSSAILAQWRGVLTGRFACGVACLNFGVLCMLEYNTKPNSEMVQMFFIFLLCSNLTKIRHQAPF